MVAVTMVTGVGTVWGVAVDMEGAGVTTTETRSSMEERDTRLAAQCVYGECRTVE